MTPRRPVDLAARRAALARLDALVGAHPRLTTPDAGWRLLVTLGDDPGPGGSESSPIAAAPASPDTEPDAPLGAHRTPDPKDEP